MWQRKLQHERGLVNTTLWVCRPELSAGSVGVKRKPNAALLKFLALEFNQRYLFLYGRVLVSIVLSRPYLHAEDACCSS